LKQLPEDGFTGIHGHPPEWREGTTSRNSNRKRTIVPKNFKNQILVASNSDFTGQ